MPAVEVARSASPRRTVGRKVALAITVVALVAVALAAQQAPEDAAQTPAGEGEPVLIDRILAVVDEDPILDSDVRRTIALGLAEPLPEETEEAFRDRVLDQLIDQKLRFHEIDRFGFTALPVEEIDRRFEEIRGRYPSAEAFGERLAELGLDEVGLRQLIARQLMVLVFVEERLGARVFVDLQRIQTYYDEVLTPALRAEGQPVPPMESVREQIRSVLKEQLLNEEIVRWTEELRREADVEDYRDSSLELDEVSG